MEREVAAMATRLESSVGLKRKEHVWDYMVEFADDFRDVEIKGGMVAVDICDHGMEKTKDGKGSGDIELPKTKGSEAESGSKTKGGEAESGSKEEGSSTTAKPAGGRKRTKMVKYRMDKSLKPLFNKKPIPFDLSRHDETFAAALRDYLEFERSVLEQFETKGYAEYEREEEVTDDEEDPISV